MQRSSLTGKMWALLECLRFSTPTTFCNKKSVSLLRFCFIIIFLCFGQFLFFIHIHARTFSYFVQKFISHRTSINAFYWKHHVLGFGKFSFQRVQELGMVFFNSQYRILGDLVQQFNFLVNSLSILCLAGILWLSHHLSLP